MFLEAFATEKRFACPFFVLQGPVAAFSGPMFRSRETPPLGSEVFDE